MEHAMYYGQGELCGMRLAQIRDRLQGLLAQREAQASPAEVRALAKQRAQWAAAAKARERADEHIRRIVATAPPLSDEQRIKLAALLAEPLAETDRIGGLRNGKAQVRDFTFLAYR